MIASGATIIRLEAGERGQMDLNSVLSSLASRGLTRLLVEGGAMTHAAFLTANLVDELHIYRAPVKLGGGLRSGIVVSDTKFCLVSRDVFSPDVLESYEARG